MSTNPYRIHYRRYYADATEDHETLEDAVHAADCMIEYDTACPSRITKDGDVVWKFWLEDGGEPLRDFAERKGIKLP